MIAMTHGRALVEVTLVLAMTLGGVLVLLWFHRPVSCPRCGEAKRDDGQPHVGPKTCARCGCKFDGITGKQRNA